MNDYQYSLEQKATNVETWQHIDLVMRLLAVMQFEIAKRQFTHDRSKLVSPEVEIFTEFTPKLANCTYGSEEYKQFLQEMKPALIHHYAHNRHHPDFFENGVEGMNLIDLVEMLCDWMAASRRHCDGDINRSIEINATRFNLSPQLAQILANTVPLLNDIFAQYKTQQDL